MNPLDGCGIADRHVAAFRFALIEFDHLPLGLQVSLVARLPLPVAAIITSGGRSLHAWIRVDAPNEASYREETSRILSLLAPLGVDQANKNPARLSRLPGVSRLIGGGKDSRQRLLFLNPNAFTPAAIFPG